MTILLDPTAEAAVTTRPLADRLADLEGTVVALLDISKPRGDVFLDRIEELLAARRVAVRRYRKPTHAKPAPSDLRRQIAEECGAVIEALAD